ncbi:helix-turn-helix transcriptional regulator [bacterium]|nr:helix-turn-helix transcriptional regulator [bacterium]
MGKKTYKYDKVLCRKFGKRITYLRKEAEITQEELAFRANISPSYMSAIERGITDTTLSTLKRLSKALNTQITDLFNFK